MIDYPGAVNRFSVSDRASAEADQDTLSPANIGLGGYWHEQCRAIHKECRELTRTSNLPQLLLDIKDPFLPRVVLGNGRMDTYATLSYMWGHGKRFLTTTKNLTAFQRGININDLPKTFADAVIVAHALGFAFLWIDALCIQHDLIQEVNQQMSLMGDIYTGSSLTIIAAHGQSVESGLAARRDPWLVRPSELVIKANVEGRQFESTIFCNEWEHGDREDTLKAPLYERGWVLQEQVLSLRALVFGSDELSWQCLTLRDFASERLPIKPIPPRQSYYGSLYNPVDYGAWVRSPGPQTPEQVLEAWYPLIENYSWRQLTYTSDTLLALSGLASRITRLYGFSYLAGLWREDIAFGLLWKRAPRVILGSAVHGTRDWADSSDRSPARNQAKRHIRNKTSRGSQGSSSVSPVRPPSVQRRQPSWSWISYFGEKGFYFLLGGIKSFLYPKATVHLQLLDAVITQPQGHNNAFGEVETAMLKIQAPVKALVIESYVSTGEYGCYGLLDPKNPRTTPLDSATGECVGEFHPDDKATTLTDGDNILCLFCVSKRLTDYCIAVVPTVESNRFVRVGLAILFGNPCHGKNGDSWCEHTAPDETRVLELV